MIIDAIAQTLIYLVYLIYLVSIWWTYSAFKKMSKEKHEAMFLLLHSSCLMEYILNVTVDPNIIVYLRFHHEKEGLSIELNIDDELIIIAPDKDLFKPRLEEVIEIISQKMEEKK